MTPEQQPAPTRGNTPAKPVLAVAADLPDLHGAALLAGALAGMPVWLKVGLELFTAEGPAAVRFMRERGFSVFLDLKFHDIPNTIQGAVRSSIALGASMLTLHLAGGEAMCRAAAAARASRADRGKGGGSDYPDAGPLLMGVTVLTSEPASESLVLDRAKMARDAGLDGVVCSGHEAARIKDVCGRDFLCLCPGIRFAGEPVQDQARVMTPAEAASAGADFLVMGRSITRAPDPAAAALRALEEMALGRA